MAPLDWLCAISLLSAVLLYWYFHVPSHLPRDLPRIPLYVTGLQLWYNLGYPEFYKRWLREPMEKHGAVITWISGNWTVVVGRPEFLMDLFRNWDLYEKAGNQARIPGTVIATFVGDNLLNSTSPNWDTYASVMMPGLQKRFEPDFYQGRAQQLVDNFITAQKRIGKKTGGVPVAPNMQQFAVDAMAYAFFDVDLRSLERPVVFEHMLTRTKPAVFSLVHRHLPFLDRLTWVLRSRQRAFKLIHDYEELVYGMARDRAKSPTQQNVTAHLLAAALEAGRISDQQFRSNLKMLTLAGHDSIQSLLMNAVWELGSNMVIQDRLRAEVLQARAQGMAISDLLTRLPGLTAIVYELLRLYPPLALVPNRTNAAPALLGGKISLASKTMLGWSSYPAHISPQCWGSTAEQFCPERWGHTIAEIHANVQRHTARGAYIPFLAHRRKCPAQGYALMQIKLALIELVRGMRWAIDPACQPKMNGFNLIFPVGLKICVEDLRGEHG